MIKPSPIGLSAWIAIIFVLACEIASAGLSKGDRIPSFHMLTTAGQTVTDQDTGKQELTILYFFSIACKSCEDGVRQLQAMVAESRDDRLLVLGIAKDSADQLERYASAKGLTFPLIAADRENLEKFNALHVHPTTYIVARNQQILELMQGGGASSEALLASLAEKQLQRGKPEMAKTLYQKALKKGAKESEAKAGIGYALLKEGQLAEAESTFQELAGEKDQQAAISGREGLAEVLFSQGQIERAEAQAEAVLRTDPNRSPARLTKGKILYTQGNKEAAAHQITLAAAPSAASDYDWQKAEANYALGNLRRENKELKIALASYRKAVDEDPYNVAALSNQGVTLQELGEPEKALEAFGKVKDIDPRDRLVGSLMRQAQEAIAEKQDLARQQRIDSLVKDLAAQFLSDRKSETSPADGWTSPPMAVSIPGFQSLGTPELMERAGLSVILQEELIRQLQALHVKVVDRALLDKLLAELKLGSSALADPDTALRLGRILAARLLTSGSLLKSGRGNRVSLRVIDTETTDIVLPLTETREQALDPTAVTANFAKAIAESIRENYPLKGRIALVEDKDVIINLGKKHGVVEGMLFNVLGDGQPVELNGKILGYRDTKLGRIEVYRVDDLMAFSRIQEKKGAWDKNQKIILRSPE